MIIFYQYTDGSFHLAGIATINKETFVHPIRIAGVKPVFKFVLKPKKDVTTGTLQTAL